MVSQKMETKKTSRKKIETAIVILNWNGCHFLQQFLSLLEQNSDGVHIFVIDNASTDGSIDYLTKEHPKVKSILLDKNYGFAEGYNRGLQQIDASYYILINSDVEVGAGWWQPLIEKLKSKDKIVAVQPKIKSFYHKDKFEYAGAAGGFIDKYGYPFCRGRILDTIEQDLGQYNDSCSIFWATGAAFAVKAENFHEVDGFDNDFFAHMEEIDLCWRLQNKGYQIYYEPKSYVYHIGGGTLPNSSSFKLYLNFRNNLFMLYKNLPSKILFHTIFIRLLLDGIAAIKFLLTGKFKSFLSIFKAHIQFYYKLPALRKKRKEIKQNSNNLIYKNSILWNYFMQNKILFSQLKQYDKKK